jgi:hypothetical protein
VITLASLFDDIQSLLKEALDLSAELGGADYFEDRSSWHLPSVAPHWQNRGFEDWVVLIELARDAWVEIRNSDPVRARRLALGWYAGPYPTFKRLAFYAAANSELIEGSEWVDWLHRDEGWWLWSMSTKREVMRLIAQRSMALSTREFRRLQRLILAGPPRQMYKEELTLADFRSVVEREVWLRLAKLRAARGSLDGPAARKYQRISNKNPDWALTENERDEFWHWMSGTGDPDYESQRDVDIAPNQRTALTEWLRRPHVARGPFYEDTWADLCATRFYLTFVSLCDLGREDQWPVERWRDALQAWSRPTSSPRGWGLVSAALVQMPDDVFAQLGRPVAWWLETASKQLAVDAGTFIQLSSRVLDIAWDDQEESGSDSLTSALNHPVGLITQALLTLWFARKPNDGDRLPEDLAPFFTRIARSEIQSYRAGRIMLAAQAIPLFRVDKDWTMANLLPLFSWTRDDSRATGPWAGFLWSPRLYWPLLNALKESFLATASHYEELGSGSRQYAAILTFAALEPSEDFSHSDFQRALSQLPQEGLEEVAQTLVQALEGSADRASQYWTDRLQVFWKNVWPKSRDLTSQRLADSIARLVIAADDSFPAALGLVSAWLQPIEHPHYVLTRLNETTLPTRFPRQVLDLLDKIISDYPWPPKELRIILDTILRADSNLSKSPRIARLNTYLRLHNL